MIGKKKNDWFMITYPLIIFGTFVIIPLIPTVQVILYKANPVWLILTIGWAISWYAGFYIWQDERNKGDK